VAVLKQVETGMLMAALFATWASRMQTFHRRKKLYAGLQTDQAGQLKQLHDEKLKRAWVGKVVPPRSHHQASTRPDRTMTGGT
jgi:hypothetical protein